MTAREALADPAPLERESADGIELGDLRVRYPAQQRAALEGVDLDVPRGRAVGIAGRTGAGKSTLALVAAGFIPRVVRATVEGAVRIAGIDPRTGSSGDLLGRAGIVFATPANQLSASKLSVREELAFGLENLGVPRGEMDARIDGILVRLSIAHLADREPYALSGGEQQRVAIASIVAMGTSVLVLDEPTAQLDPAGTAAVADLLDELAREGGSVLCAEHDPTVLARMSTCVVLDGGHVVSTAPPGRALGSPTLGPIGLRAPTIVRLAEAAGVGPELAFDDATVAAALERMPARALAAWSVPDADERRPGAWRPADRRTVPTVAIEGLRHRYPGGVEAVRGVTMRVEPGESVAIVGQNGSGKTTLVKHLIGLLRPDAGSIRLDDRDIRAEPIHRLAATVGFAFQNPDDQLFERSVEREVAFGPRTLGYRAADVGRLVDEALGAVELSDARTTNPYDLDLSRRKLVALASVLATDPAVLVLDEPTTGQDGPGVRRVGEIVDTFVGAGRTVLAITHDMEFAAAHFARIVVMRLGEVIADGPPRDILSADRLAMLESTGLTAPPAARIGARLGLGSTPTEADLVSALAAR